MNQKTLVWDAPVRVFHWLMVLCFAGAYLTAESERWRLVHVTLGYTLGGLVVFRIMWGLVGTRYARFASFVRGPGAVLRYGRSMLTTQPEHHIGHNPVGAVAIVLIMLTSLSVVVSGWASYNDYGGEWVSGLHETSANLMLGIIGVHIAGVVLASWMHHENLVRAMVNGKKEAAPADAIRSAWWPLAVLIVLAVLVFWGLQWQSAPSADTVSSGLPQALVNLTNRIFNAYSAG